MVNLNDFLCAEKSMIIAPAGYGKSHTIIAALEAYQGNKRLLILTHTHAGVASIRDKARKKGIDPSKYTLDTICSFALHITESFIMDKSKMPKPDDDNYFSFAVKTATNLLKAMPIRDFLKCTYSHIIVDEYQDCSTQQHDFIIMLSSIIKTHILGDPLQGIFDFNGSIVNLDSSQQMKGFIENKQTLNIPWRWNKGNVQLGQDLSSIRSVLCENTTSINISNYKGICFLKSNGLNEIYDRKSPLYKKITSYINNNSNSLLVIVPQKHNVQTFAKNFKSAFGIKELEAFDDKWYYNKSKLLDSIDANNRISIAHNLLLDIMPKTEIGMWINDNHKIKKKSAVSECDKYFYNMLCELSSADVKDNLQWMLNIVQLFKKKYYMKCKIEKTDAIINAIRIAIYNSISVYEGMKKDRDKARRHGRKVVGRYVGTTLLTKGLEFDSVIIINPNNFTNKKHLYVALTRASLNLIVISPSNIITLK